MFSLWPRGDRGDADLTSEGMISRLPALGATLINGVGNSSEEVGFPRGCGCQHCVGFVVRGTTRVRTRATDRHIASLGLDPEAAYEEFGQDALMKRMGKPEEIAAGAVFLASEEASFMPGAHIVIDGGATID